MTERPRAKGEEKAPFRPNRGHLRARVKKIAGDPVEEKKAGRANHAQSG